MTTADKKMADKKLDDKKIDEQSFRYSIKPRWTNSLIVAVDGEAASGTKARWRCRLCQSPGLRRNNRLSRGPSSRIRSRYRRPRRLAKTAGKSGARRRGIRGRPARRSASTSESCCIPDGKI